MSKRSVGSKRSDGPMIPDSVFPRKRTSPINRQPESSNKSKIDSHFLPIKPPSTIPVPQPPKKMFMARDPITRVQSPFAPPKKFYEEDIAYNKNPGTIPEGVRVSPVITTPHGDFQRVYSPIPPKDNENVPPKSPDVGPIQENNDWGIYDTNFKGGRRKTRKSRRTRKSRKSRRRPKSRKSKKHVKSKRNKHMRRKK